MKKFLTFFVVVLVICLTTLPAFAEETPTDIAQGTEVPEATEAPVEEPTEAPVEEPTEAPVETPTEEAVETPTEATTDILEETLTDGVEKPAESENEPAEEELIDIITNPERIVEYIKEYFEEISVIVTLIVTIFYQVLKHRSLSKSIGTLNNNAIGIAENSNSAMQAALEKISEVQRQQKEERLIMENKIKMLDAHLTQSKAANVELANELAELLVLANIPNAKKDELYKRHVEAVEKINNMEVNTDDGGEEE